MLRVGACALEITSKAGTHLGGSGWGEHRPARFVMDPLFAKAFIRTAVRTMKKGLYGCHIWGDARLSPERFDLPECHKVIVDGGSHGADSYYCVRLIRVLIKEPA